MRVLSLFDGISGAMLALRNLDIEPEEYMSSEIDENAIAISRATFPEIVQVGDVEKLDLSDPMFAGIDLLIGGSPCTNLSIAGDGTGVKGEESRLFFDYLHVRETVKPRFWLLENVGSMRKSDRDIMSEHMGCDPIAINSWVLTAQSRKRLYWTNIPQGDLPVPAGICIAEILQLQRPPGNYYLNTQWPIHVHARYSEGKFRNRNGMVKIFDVGKGRQGERIYSIYGKSANLTAGGGGPGSKTGLYYVGDYSLKDPGKDYVQKHSRRLTPVEAERLQGVPDGYTAIGVDADGNEMKMSDTERYKALGNGFTTPVIAHLLSPLRRILA